MRTLIVIGLTLVLIACKKEDPQPSPGKYEGGYLMLNEGLFQQNNSSLSYYDPSSGNVYQQVFSAENNRGLGDTANDMIYFNFKGSSYVAIAVDVSSQIEIVLANSLKSVAQIPLFNGTNAREPRKLVQQGDYLYTANFDGTISMIDLNTFEVVFTADSGQNPDGIAFVNDRVFVANSGGLNAPNYDSTLTVFNAQNLMIDTTITIAINCGDMLVDDQGELYIYSRGNYGTIPSKLIKLYPDTYQFEIIDELEMGPWDYHLGFIYFVDAANQVLRRYNTNTEFLDSSFHIELTQLQTPFVLKMETNGFFIGDANGYVNSSTIHYFNYEGVQQFQFQSGLNTNTMIQL